MENIKKKDLEIKLENVDPHPDPDPGLEQYKTPSDLAADILFTAFINGHIKDKSVVDLGCGTGILSLGAALLGAKQVKGFDIDEGSIEVARDLAEKWGLSKRVSFEKKDIKSLQTRCDTVIMNPPFGSQNKGADLPFLKKAFEISDQVYTIHNFKTLDYLRDFISKSGHDIFLERGYELTIKRTFDFHTKERENVEVAIFGIKV